jgi:acetylglutamate kinase
MLGGAAKTFANYFGAHFPFISTTTTESKIKRLPTNLSFPSNGCRCATTSASLQLPITESVSPGQFRVDILSESLPFIQKFRGKTIVVKYGGAGYKKFLYFLQTFPTNFTVVGNEMYFLRKISSNTAPP